MYASLLAQVAPAAAEAAEAALDRREGARVMRRVAAGRRRDMVPDVHATDVGIARRAGQTAVVEREAREADREHEL